MSRLTPEREQEIREFSEKTIETWSVMECPKEDMITELLSEIDELRAEIVYQRKTYNEWLSEQSSRYGLVKEQRDQLKAENEKLVVKHLEQVNRIGELLAEIDALRDENEKLNTEITEKYVSRSSHIQFCEDMAQDYIKENQKLREENKKLKAENDGLICEKRGFEAAIEAVKDGNQKLRGRIAKLRHALNEVAQDIVEGATDTIWTRNTISTTVVESIQHTLAQDDAWERNR